MKKVCLGLHDFTVAYNRLDLLLKLKKHFPDFKVSLFIIPYQKREDYGPTLVKGDFLKEIKRYLNWMQFIPHGCAHQRSEMHSMSYERFKNEALPFIKGILEEDGIPYEKGFAPPHWRWNEDVVKALDSEGWWGAITPAKPDMPRPKKFYRYSHCINEKLEGDVLKLHGHIHGTKNDLGKCFHNLLKLPQDTKWHFVTDFLEIKK